MSAHLENSSPVKTIDFYACLNVNANDRSYIVKVSPFGKKFSCKRIRKTHAGKMDITCTPDSALISSSEKIIQAIAQKKCLLNFDINQLDGPVKITQLAAAPASDRDAFSRRFFLKGPWQNGEYKIPIDLLDTIYHGDQSKARAKVTINGKKNEDVPVIFEGLTPNSTNLEKIGKVLATLEAKPDQIKIKINYNNNKVSKVSVNILDPQSNAGSPSTQFSKMSITGIKSAQDAIDKLNAGRANQATIEYIESAIRQHVLNLKQNNIGYTEELNEYMQLPEKLNNPEQIKMILTAFLENCTNEIADKQEYLKAVQYILVSLQKRFIRGLVQSQSSSADPIANDPQSVLNPELLINIMRIITNSLAGLTVEPGNTKIIITYFKTLNALLGTMMFFEMKSGRRIEHMEFCKQIKYFISKNDNNLEISYLANLSLQSVITLPDDETRKQSFLRRAFHFFKGCAIIADAIDPTTPTPWTMALHLPRAILESMGEFRKAVEIDGIKRQWFADLGSILGKTEMSLDEYKVFINDMLRSTLPVECKRISLTDHKFMYGLVNLLSDTLNTPNLPRDTAQATLDLLEKIWLDNENGKKGSFTIKADKYKAQLRSFITERISIRKNASTDIIISKLADDLFKKLNIGIDVSIPQDPLSVKPVKNTRFQEALESADPTLRNIKAMQDELGNDEQLKSETMYYISLQGRNEGDTKKIYFMDSKIDAFLQEKDKKMLVMLGNAGSGKSLFTKRYVFTKLTEEYTPDGYLPIYVYLPSFKQSFFGKKLLEDILGRFGFDIETDPVLRNAFHQRKILWVLDSYDEIDFDGKQRIALSDIINFKEWTNSKFLVTCRTQGFAQIGLDKFRIRESTKPEVIYTAEFDPTKVKEYFKKFAEVYKKQNTNFSWTYYDYIQVINILEGIDFVNNTLLKNPLMVKLLAFTIPLMITIDKNDQNGSKLRADVMKKFSGDPKIIDNHIKHTMAAFIAERSYRNCRNIDDRHEQALEAKDFLRYTSEFALNLRRYNMTGCKWPIPEAAKMNDSAKVFFSKMLDDTIEPNFIYKNKCLSYRNSEWTLEHEELIYYYSRLIGGIDSNDYELVEELRQTEEFQSNYNAVHGY